MDERVDALVALVQQQAEMLQRQAEAVNRQAETVDRQGAELQQLRLQVQDLQRSAGTRVDLSGVDPAGVLPVSAGEGEVELPRRRLMRLLGAGAAVGVAAVGAGVVAAGPAAADPNNPLIIGQSNAGATSITTLTASPSPNSSALAVINNATDEPIGIYGIAGPRSAQGIEGGAVIGSSSSFVGVSGLSDINVGVSGTSTSNDAVYGSSQSGQGVHGISISNNGVYGLSTATASGLAGVQGYAFKNVGVLGVSLSVHGVAGVTQTSGSLGTFPASGVVGQAVGGRGVTGDATTGAGVYGQAGSGVGVTGASSTGTGIGGQFQGGRAQLYLVPSTTTGAPTSGTHKVGELFLDKTGALYVCKTAGTPGTWKLLG